MDLDQLRQEDPHVRHVLVSLLPGQKASALLLRVLMDAGGDPDHVAQIVSGRVSSLWTRERTEGDLLARLKATFDAELMLDEPPQIVRAIDQAQIAALGPRPISRAEVVASIRDVASSDVAKFAYDHLGQQRRHAVLFTPSDVVTGPAHRRPAAAPSAPHADNLFADAASWDPMELPGVASPISNVVMKKLATGLTVIVARRRAASATAWLGFHGGYSDIDPPLVVELALRARPEAVAAAKYGALAGRGATRDASLVTLEFRAADLEQALALLFAKATTPIQKWPPREGLERLVASVNADVDAASARANGAFWRALFGDHPFARVLTAADLARVTRADVDAWIGRVHNVRNAVLIVVGDVNVEDVSRYATELSQKVGAPAWVDAVPPVAPPPLRPATAEHVTTVVTSRPGALTDVRLGCLLPPMAAKDRADFETLRLAMQERLSSALRVERGEGYGVDVSYEWLRGGTAFLQV
jgi:zinc protease